MVNHPNRGWRGRWVVDTRLSTATHRNGLCVKFTRDADGWDGECQHLPDNIDPSQIARLMREAGDIFAEKIHD